MKNLHNWVITYNQYTNSWLAASRDNAKELFSGGPNVLKFKNIDTLIAILSRTGGNKAKIAKLIK